jgi:hypothetical protein
MERTLGWLVAAGLLASACGGGAPAAQTPANATSSATPVASATVAKPTTPKKPIDAARVAAVVGGKPQTLGDVVKVAFPRNDVKVSVDGWSSFPPFMGLTSWAAFTPGEKTEATVMGDLVLFEDEVNPAMSAALDHGLEVTALHNHFFYDKPHVYFMHIGGGGTLDALATAVKATFDAAHAVRAKHPQPASTFGPPPPKTPSKIDAAKLDAVFGAKGMSKNGMYKATMGRKTEHGGSMGKAMGVATWAAFGGTDDDAVVDGDFAVSEDELQPVLKALRGGGIHIVAIHSHMTHERPRILFLHYWGRGKAAELAGVVKRAVDLTAWDGRHQG